MARKGRLFVISASSGTGKTTLAKELLKEDPNLVQSVSCTTRPRRPNELNRTDYYFIDRAEFIKRKKTDGFLEWAKVFDNFYGTPKKEVEELLDQGKDVLLLIDMQGAKKVKKVRTDAIFIFLAPPTKEELKRRLEKRGTESKDEINKRFGVATRELKELNKIYFDKAHNDHRFFCDYRIVNRDIRKALVILKAIIAAERLNGE